MKQAEHATCATATLRARPTPRGNCVAAGPALGYGPALSRRAATGQGRGERAAQQPRPDVAPVEIIRMADAGFSVHVRFDRHGRPLAVSIGNGAEKLDDGRGHPVVTIRSGLSEAKARECERLLNAAIERDRGSRAVVLIEGTGKRAAPAPIFREADSAPSIAPLDLAQPWI